MATDAVPAEGLDKLGQVLTSKRSRSTIFLVISALIILGLNALLPTIEGSTHYTAEAVEMSYADYKRLSAGNRHYNITWGSERRIEEYLDNYREEHPELSVEEFVGIEPPDNFQVLVYTKFFYQSTFWWLSTATSLSSAIILFYSLFNYLVTRMKDTYKKYNELQAEMERMNDNILVPNTFEPWMDNVFNYNRKIKQHRNNINYKIDKLERRTNFVVKQTFKQYFDDMYGEECCTWSLEDVNHNIRWWQFRYRKYFRKKSRLMSLLDTDYISHFVAHGKVKHFKYIHPMFIYNGTNSTGRMQDEYSTLRSDGAQLANDAGAKLLLSLTVTVLLAVLVMVTAVASIEQEPLWRWLNIAAKLIPLAIQVPLAYDYTNSYMSKHLIKNLRSRRAIGLRYAEDIRAGVDIRDPLERIPKEKGVEPNAEKSSSEQGHGDSAGLGKRNVEQGYST